MTDDYPAPPPLTGEPTLEDLLAEPMVQAVMRVDGLAEADLREALARVRRALKGELTA